MAPRCVVRKKFPSIDKGCKAAPPRRRAQGPRTTPSHGSQSHSQMPVPTGHRHLEDAIQSLVRRTRPSEPTRNRRVRAAQRRMRNMDRRLGRY